MASAALLAGLFVVLLVLGFMFFHGYSDRQADGHMHASSHAKQAQTSKSSEGKTAAKRADATVVADPAIDRYLSSLHFNGTVMIVRNDKVIVSKGYGYANIEQKRPNDPDSTFYIASIQKALVATAVMQLQEAGKLNVHDPVARYLPKFPGGQTIQLFNLLTHTSGIKGHKEGIGPITPDELIADIEQRGLRGTPGIWQYNDSNYSVLSYIIEKLTHEPLERYMASHIFQKAGLTHTGFYETYNQEPNATTGYKYVNGRLVNPPLLHMSQLYGCGNIYMSPADLFRFDHALASGQLIDAGSLKQMLTPYKATYGFGFYADPGSYSDHGVLPGWNLLNSFSRSFKTYVVLMSNIQNNIPSFGLVNEKIYELLNHDND